MLCVYSVFVAICNTRNSLTTKRHAPVPARSVASLPASRLAALACYAVARRSLGLRVFACYALTGAIVCRPTLCRWGLFIDTPTLVAPSLRAPFSFCVVPVVARLRRSTTGYCLSPLAGLQFRLTFGSQSALQLPIYRARRDLSHLTKRAGKTALGHRGGC